MSITSRDRKILLIAVPLVLLLVYWFMVLGPKRDEASKLGEQLTEQQGMRDKAKADADRLSASQAGFRTEYASIVRLGKAVPSTVDMPGLILQLDQAARGTGIHFTKIATGERTAAAPPAAASATGSTDPNAPAAPGGETAQSAPGKTTENAGNSVDAANKKEADRGLEAGDTKTSEPAKDGAVPVGGGDASTAASGSPAAGAPGLDTVPLELTFSGSYFDLADFFHRLKRFVRVANDRILVSGRLLTIDTFAFANADGKLTTDITATVYLVPKTEGVAAGATPNGPAPGGTTVASAGPGAATTPPSAATTPTAGESP